MAGPKKDPLDRIIDAAVAKWRRNVGATPAATAGFEALRSMLRPYARDGLKAKTQEFPPKYDLVLPPAKRGGYAWEFASVSAVGNDVYFDLYPLGLDVTLRNLAGPSLRRLGYRPDDGFKLPGGGAKLHGEIAGLIETAHAWFRREVVGVYPLPPSQLIDQYLIETPGWGDDSDPDLDPPAAAFAPLSATEKALVPRLAKAFGKGAWKRAATVTPATLPGWAKSCEVELHWYSRQATPFAAKPGGAEAWKIARFVKCHLKEQPADGQLVYAAASDFRASLEAGRAYRCSATLGRKFQAYVRIADESGGEYWYPERFFVPG